MIDPATEERLQLDPVAHNSTTVPDETQYRYDETQHNTGDTD